MIDIFDIINERRDKRIHITGVVSELRTSPFTTDEINDLIFVLMKYKDEMDTVEFEIQQDVAHISRSPLSRGIYGAYEPMRETVDAITFNIDVYMNARLYNEIYNRFESFIDYFTIGVVKYDIKDELMITTDYEAYTWWNEMDREASYDLGSYPRTHDADGDAMFAAQFGPTDMSNMFSNMVLTLDGISRPVMDREVR